MEAKPFSLQSPEKVAEAYGGNKQKIAQAIQMGTIDPTSGLLAGMFIDRMRSAQAMEQAPQQTVAQKVFAPPAPPAPPGGLGAIAPQGGGMPAPQGPQMASAAPMGMPAPMGQPPVGMAAGGMTELPASSNGGLTTLPLPDDMYNEESFAGGGIVAFADGGGAIEKRITNLKERAAKARTAAERQAYLDAANQLMESEGTVGIAKGLGSAIASPFVALKDYYTAELPPEPAPFQPENPMAPVASKTRTAGIPFPPARNVPKVVTPEDQVTPPPTPPAPRRDIPGGAPRVPAGPSAAAAPEDNYGLPKAPGDFNEQATFDNILNMMGKAPGMEKMSEEDKAARKNEDLWTSLAQIGFGMAAGESPNFLTNVGKATAAATPAMQEALKERRASEKEERKDELERQRLEYGARGTAATATRAEKNAMREYGLNLAQAKAKIANDEAQLKIQRQQLANTAGYYDYLKNKDTKEINNAAKIILDAGKANNMEDAKYLAWQATQVRPGVYGKPKDPLQARRIAETAYDKQFTQSMNPPPKEGREAWIANYARNIMAVDSSGGGLTLNPYMDDADKILGITG